jgi:DNA polymerase-3 subunit alpha
MPAAMTDHANLMGAFHFVRDILNHKAAEAKNAALIENGEEPTEVPMKPIVGCEFYVCEDHKDKTQGQRIPNSALAKTKKGYHNLAKMSSIAYTQGFIMCPELIGKSFSNTRKILSGNLNGEIPNKILNLGENQAEEALLWWKDSSRKTFIWR